MSSPISARSRKAAQILETRQILQQQNKEYAESVAKDTAKKEEKEKRRLTEAQRNQRKKIIEEYREKAKVLKFDGPLKVLARFPDGRREVFGFNESDKVDRLFDAIISHSSCPNYFFVRSVYPKMEVSCYPVWYQEFVTAESPDTEPQSSTLKTFSEHGISNNSVLFVNMIS